MPINNAKEAERYAMQKSNILFLITGVVVIIGIGIVVWWAWTIEAVSIKNHTLPGDTTLSAVAKCTDTAIGKHYFLLSRESIEREVRSCDYFVETVHLSFTLPRELIVDVSYFVANAKVIVGDHCLLYGKDNHIVIPIDRCLEVLVPQVTGLESLSNEPLNQYIALVIKTLKEYSIPFSSIEYISQGGSSWLSIQLDETHKTLIGINANVSEKVRTLQASIQGLKEAKEPYGIIDLRFDRVVYK